MACGKYQDFFYTRAKTIYIVAAGVGFLLLDKKTATGANETPAKTKPTTFFIR